ncbi:DUF1433 domain-containing protein [Bacillus vallismortis]|uniref:DUF1433 domain-containing protein n=1 Tax=Bacillus vallismortis TaxID=72361 RepID=A0ABY4XWN4_BACVA|nr:DUF1433 domain-containing protein [Bacillus vallismortis]USP94663.1 DUF1433 domain-containing protein [Bacillus vallismortis]
MKKYLIILPLLIIAVGGMLMKHYVVKKEENALFEKANSKMSEYLHSEYNGIEKISYYDDYFIDPTGGITVEGYLNGDKTKEFDGLYDPVSDKIGSFSVDAEEKS